MRRTGTWTRFRTAFGTLPVRLLLCVVVPLAMVMLAAGLWALGSLERQFERRMQEEVELIARALQRPVSDALQRGQRSPIAAALGAAFDFRRVYGAYVYDDRGKLLAASGHVDWMRTSPSSELHIQGGGGYETVAGSRVYSYYVPVYVDASGRAGLLQVARRKSDIDAYLAQLRWHALLAFGVGLALMTGVVLFGYHAAVGRALARFRSSMLRVESGDLGHRATLQGPTETRTIIESFNQMLDSIQRARHRLGQEREQKAELAAQLATAEKLASIGRVAGGIAHELGTPLGTIAGRVQRLLRSRQLDSPSTDELRKVDIEVQRLTRIVREVLDFARVEPHRKRLVTIESVVATAARTVSEGDIGNVSVAAHVSPKDHLVLADPARLERAIVNLLRNAIQASSAGDEVVVSTRAVTERVVAIDVDDDGHGVPSELLSRIFEPFFTTRSGRGTGLGLAIVEAVAKQHFGLVTAEPREQGGTRFSLKLPLALEEDRHRARSDNRNSAPRLSTP